MARLILFLLSLGIGAVVYSLLRTEEAPAAGGTGERAADGPAAKAPPARPAPRAARPAPRAAAAPAAAGRCAAITRSGKRCTRDAEPGAAHCWQHGG